jgi:hypothetical protein
VRLGVVQRAQPCLGAAQLAQGLRDPEPDEIPVDAERLQVQRPGAFQVAAGPAR